ncbi:DUF4031 domain-containing protein [Gulosibacter macacae]|uniref:DUF4031 domain-containing protein n=1 Tax=Gulosibacter macacae TaxID=2488791 RepID=A0A3P3VU36_9MICO|nr:DUF4031 domain-containing protein [Gulosibacter macacae]RRJ86315.1 DUF4031 domain-containing protein [Gulosibacter macacae]
MTVLIDPPYWRAHGTIWSHMVSDSDHAELHAFAQALGLPRRAFDLDHYDVPERLHGTAVASGAEAVSGRELLSRLVASELRVRRADRPEAARRQRIAYLHDEWARLGERLEIETSPWGQLGASLIDRWSEPHRRYHDLSHLHDVLLALDQLSLEGSAPLASDAFAPTDVEVQLAAWFHDAIYQGTPDDEHDSAELAGAELRRLGLSERRVDAVVRLVLATKPGSSDAENPDAAPLLDADLSIFAAGRAHYQRYTEAVRDEYEFVPEEDFRQGRARILESYLQREWIYASARARELWESRARANLAAEIAALRA